MFISPARAERAQKNEKLTFQKLFFLKKIITRFFHLPAKRKRNLIDPLLSLPKLSNPTCAKKGDLDVLAAFSRVNEIIQLFH